MLPARLDLARSHLDRAEEVVNDLAHPESPNNGNHWSPDDVVELCNASKESVVAVMEGLF